MGKATLVQTRTEEADGMRGLDQHHQAAPRPRPLSLPRTAGNEAMGRTERDHRQL